MRALAFLVGLTVVSACSGGHLATRTDRRSLVRVTSAGYQVATPLPAGAPGVLIAEGGAPSLAQELGASYAWRILYHSTDLAGRDIAVSGMVLIPKGNPPSGGWPVVAWAHGTTGLADQCAPSIAARLGDDKSALGEISSLLAQHLLVVASDYPGLGTSGLHAYLIGKADARAVIDSVAAAHALPGLRVSKSWITVGHSEGGSTALFVAQAARQRAPQWNFVGTVALAPASTLDALIAFVDAAPDPVEQSYLVYALEGLSTVDPHLNVASLLTPRARGLLSVTTTGCIDDIINAFERAHLTQLLSASAATKARLAAELGNNDNPDRAHATGPILIAQGTADRDVPQGATNGLVGRLCALHDNVDYRLYPGRDHNNLVAGSQLLVDRWIAARFAGEPAVSTCK
jgi:alpha-beta hydrolase superfamily lysophospholipase